jgi:hypothetical protein
MTSTRVTAKEPTQVKGGSTTIMWRRFASGQLMSNDLPAMGILGVLATVKSTRLNGNVGTLLEKFARLSPLDNLSNDIKTLLDQIKIIPTDPARQAHGLYTKLAVPLMQDAEKVAADRAQLAEALAAFRTKFIADFKTLFGLLKQTKTLDAATQNQLSTQLKAVDADVVKHEEMLRKYQSSYIDTKRTMQDLLSQMKKAATPLGILPTVIRAEEKTATPRQGG